MPLLREAQNPTPAGQQAKKPDAPALAQVESDVRTKITNHIVTILSPLEDEWVESKHDGSVNARVKRLRSGILPDLVKGDIGEAERERRWKQLADQLVTLKVIEKAPPAGECFVNP